MDDQNFSDPKTALAWIELIESEKANIRENDLYPLLKGWAKSIAPANVLDMGSGQGVCSEKLELSDCDYTGLEPSSLLVERAKELYSHSRRAFVLGSIYEMPFADHAFDSAFSIAVWHLLSDLDQAAHELARVLKPGAHFLIVTANPDSYPLWTDLYSEGKQYGHRFEGRVRLPDQSELVDVLYLYSKDEILRSFEKVDLSVIKVETFRERWTAIYGRK